MNKHTFNRLALLFIVVALSGCVGQSATGGASNGVIIKSFSPDISEIFSGDSVVFSLSVENVGGEDATYVKAKLFGLGTDWDFIDEETQEIADVLERSQPEYKVPGGIGDAQWEVESPWDLKVDNTYTAVVRLYYGYKTTALANIKVYNSEYLRSNPEDAESIMRSSGVESFTVTDAPLIVELAGLARPLIYREDGSREASITFLIDNIGQGKPYTDTESDMEITVESILVDDDDCLNDIDDTPRLPRAGKKSIPCRFELPDVDEYTTIPVEIVLSYNYFLDDTTSIKVLKSLYVGEGPTTTWDCVEGSTCTKDNDCPPPGGDYTRRDCRNGLCCYK